MAQLDPAVGVGGGFAGARPDFATGTAGVPASEFGRRLAARTDCWGEDAPQLAAADGCGTRVGVSGRLDEEEISREGLDELVHGGGVAGTNFGEEVFAGELALGLVDRD